MKYTSSYILYPLNRNLENAMINCLDLLDAEQAGAAIPDRSTPMADNFLHTRGNYEQKRYSAGTYETMRAALESDLTEEKRHDKPAAWADGQNYLGNMYAALGQLQSDASMYEKAIACFNLALEVVTQESAPMEWAELQTNLGMALHALGSLNTDAKILSRAVDAFTNALLVYTKTDTPEEWKLVMLLQGMTMHSHGLLLKGNRTFQKSVVVFKNAIAELDADNYAFELAAAHNNCGAVLHNLAESEENADRFEEAIRSYETGWKVCMEQQLPVHLSVLCRVNKITARGILASFKQDFVLAEEVADEFEVIIECFPHALQPLCKKHCETQMEQLREMVKSSAA